MFLSDAESSFERIEPSDRFIKQAVLQKNVEYWVDELTRKNRLSQSIGNPILSAVFDAQAMKNVESTWAHSMSFLFYAQMR